MRKLWKRSLSLALVGGLLITLGLSANAYYVYPGAPKLIDGIYDRSMYIESDLPCYDSALQALADWNWVLGAENWGHGVDFYFKRVTHPDADMTWGDISIIARDRPDELYIAITDFYNNAHQNLDVPKVDYHYTRITINSAKTPHGSYYQEMRKIVNHEIGHAIGLAHNPDDNGTIMYDEYWNGTAYSPTLDDITGVCYLYG